MTPKTVHITNAFHETSGGISTFYRALMTTAQDQGRQIRLIVPAETTRVEAFNNCAKIYYLAARPAPLGDARYRCLWAWGRTGRALKEILRTEQPDLVEIADKYTLPYLAGLLRRSWVRGLPRKPILIATSHERLDDALRSYTNLGTSGQLFAKLYMRFAYFPLFDWHVANSEYTADELFPASVGHRLYRELRVLPMGVDCEVFHPVHRTEEGRCASLRTLDLPCDRKLLIYAGRLSREKNLDLLVGTVRNLPPDYTLVVAGEGELKEDLKEQLQGRARFTGHMAKADLAGLFAAADAFIHPNPREPFGIAPLEAMAAALPVVGPPSGGLLSYAHAGNAWLASPEPEAFAEAVRAIFRNEEERTRRTLNARRTAEEFSWPRIAARFFDLFDEAVERGFPVRSLQANS
ncbi:MAG TPA: glycosyltransferase [Bryobacteraceae bacterium]|nr:glycosyltransferase [Bryobacteraceae bacterium]